MADGASLYFDKANPDYITRTTSNFAVGVNSTVSMWIDLDSYDGNGAVLWGTTNGNIWWQLLNDTTVYIHATIVDITAHDFTNLGWCHVAMTNDGSNLRAYVDGVQAGSTSGAGTSVGTGSKAWRFGNWAASGAFDFDGRAAHFHFYDRALPVEQINQIMRRPASIDTGLLVYWDMMGSDSGAVDRSGNGEDGTLTTPVADPGGPPVSIGSHPLPILVPAGAPFSGIVADSGSYTYTGHDADLIAPSGVTMVADSGSYTYTGHDATLLVNRYLSADAGSYTYTGYDATFTQTRGVVAESGSYGYTGYDAGLIAPKKVIAESGVYGYTGHDVTLTSTAQARWRDLEGDPAGPWSSLGGAAAGPWVDL